MKKQIAHMALSIYLLTLGISAFAAETDEEKIDRTYAAWVRAANAKDLEKWSAFLAPDAWFSPADATPLTTDEEILDYYRKSFADPEFSLSCEQHEINIADSDGMAWSRGVCRGTFPS